MLLSRKLDDKEIQLKNQSQIFFQISGAGHEAMLVAAGLTLQAGLRLVLSRTIAIARCACSSASRRSRCCSPRSARRTTRASGGRQMPSHWGTPALNIVSGSSADRHAGAARGRRRRSRRHLRAASPRFPIATSRFHADEIVYVSLGEGATSEGEFWEALNAACTKQLPVLFLVEDNGYAISVPVEVQTAGGDISRLVRVVSRPARRLDRRHRFLRQPARDARGGRLRPRAQGPGVRPRARHPARTRTRCPTTRSCTRRRPSARPKRGAIRSRRFAEFLRDATARHRRRSARRSPPTSSARSTRRRRQALQAPKPAQDTAALWVYSPDVDPTSAAFDTPAQPEGKPDTMVGADQPHAEGRDGAQPAHRRLRRGRRGRQPARKRSPVVSGKGGVFKVTHGLQRLYGDDRVFNSPLAEASIIGRAVGMATRGLKPVVEIQFFDYIWPAMMQIRDEMSMMRYRSGNHFSCPMVDPRADRRLPARRRAVPQPVGREHLRALPRDPHRVSVERASTRPGLLRTAIRCDDPVMFLEHKHLYRQTYNKGEYPGQRLHDPVRQGEPAPRRRPTCSSITWGALVQRSLLAAQQAEKDGISVAVLDLRTIVPYDWEAIAAHVKRTNRVVIAHEDQLTCGFGAEIAARIAGELFEHLDAPVRRVGALDTPGRLLPRSRRSHPAAVGRRPRRPSAKPRATDSGSRAGLTLLRPRACRGRRVAVVAVARSSPTCSQSVGRDAGAHRGPFPRAGRLSAVRVRPVFRLRSPRATRVTASTTAQASAWEIVQIGAEPGRIIDPTAFAVDARRHVRRRRRARATASASRSSRRPVSASAASSCRAGREARVVLDNIVLNGIGSLQYTGTSILMSQPETGALITEYTLAGGANRTFGDAAADRPRRRPRAAPGAEQRLAARRSDGRLLLRVPDRRAGVPEVRRGGTAGVRAPDPGPRDRRVRRRTCRRRGRGAGRRRRTAAGAADDPHGGGRCAAAGCGSLRACPTPTSSIADGDKIRDGAVPRGGDPSRRTISSSTQPDACS